MTDAAMQAAAEALHDGGPDRYTACVMGQDCGIRAEHTKLWITEAEAAVAVARPIIEAEIRERIAAEIEEVGCGDVCGCSITIENAVRIARGGAS